MNKKQNSKKEENTKGAKEDDFPMSIFRWRMKGKEIENQIENYDSLDFLSSARLRAVALMVLGCIITFLLIVVGQLSIINLIDIFLILIFAIFTYKGKRWALIGVIIFFTIDTILNIETGGAWRIFIWIIFMKIFWQALQVENERHKINLPNKERINKKKLENTETIKKDRDNDLYCSCGYDLDKEDNFCSNCGLKK